MKKPHLVPLTTPFEASAKYSWSEYPRPQLVRDSYLPLDGMWELSVKRGGVETPLGGIKMPYVPESRLSGIERTLKKGEKWVYRRRFILSEGFNTGRVLLHFGAVDQIARVTVNGYSFPRHIGGYLPFSYDITDNISHGENLLTVEVTDELDTDIPYGKQRKKRGGMWYTPVSGIWQPVWLESVPHEHIKALRLTPTLESITVGVIGGAEHKRIEIETPSGTLCREFDGEACEIVIDSPRLWSPEDPYLYHFTLYCGEDKVRSYFALRTLGIGAVGGRQRLLLNGKPYFFHGLLDQGYFSDGIYLPAAPDGYLWDIQAMKSLGFNMLRKHIKVEPELFYYYCDKYGMVVFQDMVNSGKYSFLIDTALPTVGPRRGIAHRASKRRRELFERHCADTTEHLYNHPCVGYYTIFNEGWGQYDADRLYRELKALDGSRIWDPTSGWFNEKESDVQSEHIYFKKVDFKLGERPVVLSEFGGYSCRVDGHVYNLDRSYGYKTMADPSELSAALERLYMDEVVPLMRRGLCAAVLTQVSDVEDEINGLVTYDRQVVKADAVVMRRIRNAIDEAECAICRGDL